VCVCMKEVFVNHGDDDHCDVVVYLCPTAKHTLQLDNII